MNLSISTMGLYPAKISDVLDFLERVNVEFLEVVREYPYHDLSRDDFNSHSVELSIHAPISDINIASHIDNIRQASINEMEETFRMANELDAECVVVHPGKIPKMALKFTDKILEYNTQSILECKRLAEDYGVTMCLENMPLQDGLLYSNLEALFDFSQENDVKLTLDVGHAHNCGYSVEQMFESENIRHVHLSDNDGSHDAHMALGTCDVDFEGVFHVLESKGYDGICTVEVKSVKGVYDSLDYLKNIKRL